MCLIGGFSFAERINFTAENFNDVSYDGWGILKIDSHSGILKKDENYEKKFFIDEKANNFLLHIRQASSGIVNYKNTHPFGNKEKNLFFCHNGTISKEKMLNLFETNSIFLKTGKRELKEKSDSLLLFEGIEYYFKFLNKTINEETIKNLRILLNKINKVGRLNAIIVYYDNFFVYQDENGYNQMQYIKINKNENFEIANMFYKIKNKSYGNGIVFFTNNSYHSSDKKTKNFLNGHITHIENGNIKKIY